jgi:pimeloyl-[acyl-carrier protein] synthase
MNMSLTQNKQVYDLLSPEALLNPYPLYNQLRLQEPVYFSEPGGFWFLSRYQDVEAALLDPRLSSDKTVLYKSQLGNLDINLIKNYIQLTDNWIVDLDPPKHTRMRKLAFSGFTVSALENWRSIIQDTTDSLLDKVQHLGSMDIVADLSSQLPSIIISKIFGVPEEDRQNFTEWGTDIATFWGSPSGINIEEAARKADIGAKCFIELIKRIMSERRFNRGTDMISLLMTAYEENGMDLDEIPALCVLILDAGHVTTVDLIPNGVNALLNHPSQLLKLKENPELINSAVEEMIRFDAPVPVLFRIAAYDLTIGNTLIKTGSVVALGTGSANHDPEKFESPEVFDITRNSTEHFGFGKGIHFCLGAVLARMELTICFNTLLKRMPNISFDADRASVPKRKSFSFNGFESLHIKF